MTQEEIMEMAREAHRKLVTEVYVGHMGQLNPWEIELLKIFAKLVAAKEREACAKLCDELPAPNVYSDSDKGMWDITSLACGDAIRARGEQA